MMNKKVLLMLTILYACLMLFGAVWPNLGGIQALKDTIKVWHLLGFMVLAILILKTLESYKYRRKYTFSGILCIIFIYFTEWVQTFSPTRHFMYTDMLIDLCGVILGFLFYKFVLYKS